MHANFIWSFDELAKLTGAKNLRTLTIHANPVEEYGEFRIIICNMLPSLKKIDSTLLTKRETERAGVLKKSLKKFPVIKNPRKPPEESENEEEA